LVRKAWRVFGEAVDHSPYHRCVFMFEGESPETAHLELSLDRGNRPCNEAAVSVGDPDAVVADEAREAAVPFRLKDKLSG
jgi:hypothetical protein